LKDERILISHGSGGKKSQELTERIFLKYFNDPALLLMNDQAVMDIDAKKIAISTDTYTIDPIFFPGGNIGSLSVHGTVNDVAMSGATPVAMSAGFILEEGLMLSDLEKIAESMSVAAGEAGVRIVTADTKVVARGAVDRIFINTTGIGILDGKTNISGQAAKIGDRVILSGTIGDHGIAIASSREGIEFSTPVVSDSASLNYLVQTLLEAVPEGVHVMRDPTRGGLATVLNEIASQSSVGILIEEAKIPLKEAVIGACELFGFDPLYLANEGKMVAFVRESDAEQALEALKSHPLGRDAMIIGEVVDNHPSKVVLATLMGGRRLVDRLTGDMLPRIC